MPSGESQKGAEVCGIRMRTRPTCGRKARPNERRCICHSEKPDKSPEVFWHWVEKTREEDCDFSRFVFPGHSDFSGKEFVKHASFVGAEFHGEVNFAGAIFHAGANFGEATFRNSAIFSGADFRHETEFRSTIFCADADFHVATFSAGVPFDFARFEGNACLASVSFGGGPISFSDAHFLRSADFSHSKFTADAHFDRAEFHHAVSFVCATFAGKLLFRGSGENWVFPRNEEVSFLDASSDRPGGLEFRRVFLGRARLLGLNLRKATLADVRWARRLLGRHALWDELRPGRPGTDEDNARLEEYYRQLKQNYEAQLNPIGAGSFYFGEMRMRRLSHSPRHPVWRFLKRNVSVLALYEWVSGYGESYLRAFVWGVLAVLLCAAAFALIPAVAIQELVPSRPAEPVREFGAHLLHSAMCFLPLGDRPFEPVHLDGHYLSGAERVIGAAIIAMFVLAVNRRFKR